MREITLKRTMPAVRVNGVNVSYHQAGLGPDVVLIHGLGANLAFWYFRILPFLTPNYRVTLYDLKGHGYTDMPPSGYTSADMAGDLHCLLNKLGVRNAHLVGHSFGGVVALHFAVLFPEQTSSLTIADSRVGALQSAPKLKEWPYWKKWKPRLERIGIRVDDEQEIDFRLLESLALCKEPLARSRSRMSPFFIPFQAWNSGRRGAQQWLRVLSSTTGPEDFKSLAGLTLEKIRQVRQQTQTIYGQFSFCLPSCHALQDNLPNCRTRLVPRAGHFYPVVRPQIFVRHLRRFLQVIEKSKQWRR